MLRSLREVPGCFPVNSEVKLHLQGQGFRQNCGPGHWQIICLHFVSFIVILVIIGSPEDGFRIEALRFLRPRRKCSSLEIYCMRQYCQSLRVAKTIRSQKNSYTLVAVHDNGVRKSSNDLAHGVMDSLMATCIWYCRYERRMTKNRIFTSIVLGLVSWLRDMDTKRRLGEAS